MAGTRAPTSVFGPVRALTRHCVGEDDGVGYPEAS